MADLVAAIKRGTVIGLTDHLPPEYLRNLDRVAAAATARFPRNPRGRLLYLVSQLDDSHMSLKLDAPAAPHHRFALRATLPELSRYTRDARRRRFHLDCAGHALDGSEVLEVDGRPPLRWLREMGERYDVAVFGCPGGNTFACDLTRAGNVSKVARLGPALFRIDTLLVRPTAAAGAAVRVDAASLVPTPHHGPAARRPLAPGAAVLEIRSFSDVNFDEARRARAAQRLVIDLRNNGGGDADVAYRYIEAIFGPAAVSRLRVLRRVRAVSRVPSGIPGAPWRAEFDNDNPLRAPDPGPDAEELRVRDVVLLHDGTSASMAIIFVAWVRRLFGSTDRAGRCLHSRRRLLAYGDETDYQRQLSNPDGVVQLPRPYAGLGLRLGAPAKFVLRDGFRAMHRDGRTWAPDFYYSGNDVAAVLAHADSLLSPRP